MRPPRSWKPADGQQLTERFHLRSIGPLLIGLVILAGLAQLVAGALQSGVTNDEPIHVARTASWLDTGWYVPEAQMSNGRPDASLDGGTIGAPFVYGPAWAAGAHALNVAAGNEEIATVSQDADATAVRHLFTALIGAVAAFACGAAVWSLTASWRFGLWTVAALLVIPLWSGMSFFNPKDIPAAAGYTLFTVGLILALSWSQGPRFRVARPWAIGALIAGGIFIGAGTRLAFWLPLAASLVTYALMVLIQRRTDGGAGVARRIDSLAIGLGVLAGTVSVVAIYPTIFADPFELLRESISSSSEFPWTGFTLTAGRLVSEHPPWWYLPVWGFASTPVLIGLFALGGAGAAIAGWFRARREPAGWLAAIGGRRDLGVVLALQQLLLLSGASLVLGSTMYTGLRQHLYILPAAAILAGFGVHRLWIWSKRPGTDNSIRRRVVAVLAGLALLVPLTEGLLLFPYNYVYVNPIAGIGGINGRWETDYWWSSAREARSRVPAGIDLLCLPPTGFGDTTTPVAPEDCGEDRSDQFFSERPADRTGFSGQTIGKVRSGSVIPPNCEEAGSVTRWLRGEEVIMSYVLDCKSAPDLDAGLKP